MVKIVIYVEGGGDHNEKTRTACRRGFTEFFKKAGFQGKMPRIIVCGGRTQAYKDFCHAIEAPRKDTVPLLLVDSEKEVESGISAWEHLLKRDNWNKPGMATNEQVHLMVQCMEAWFIADLRMLQTYFGQGFKDNQLNKWRNRNLEEVPKKDLLEALEQATSQTKKIYRKGEISFELLERIDPSLLQQRSQFAKRLIQTINQLQE